MRHWSRKTPGVVLCAFVALALPAKGDEKGLVPGTEAPSLDDLWSSGDGLGLIHGRDHAYLLKAPAGWVIDNDSGVSQGLHAVFYPRGRSWEESPAVMYGGAAHKGDPAHGSLDAQLTFDEGTFRKRWPDITIREGPDLVAGDGGAARVRLFGGGEYRNVEAVAYVDESKVVVLIVLSARSVDAFAAAWPAFEELVASYRFVADDVQQALDILEPTPGTEAATTVPRPSWDPRTIDTRVGAEEPY